MSIKAGIVDYCTLPLSESSGSRGLFDLYISHFNDSAVQMASYFYSCLQQSLDVVHSGNNVTWDEAALHS